MPLADVASMVIHFLKNLREVFLLQGKSGVFIERIKGRIPSIPETPLITTGNHAGPARGTDRVGDVSAGKSDALVSDAIDMGRRYILAAVEADVRIALISVRMMIKLGR